MTGKGTATGSAGAGGASPFVLDLLKDAKSKGDLDEISNCSLVTGSLFGSGSIIGLPVVDVALAESPCLSLVTSDPYIRYSSAVNGRASVLNLVTLIGLGPGILLAKD